MWHHAACTSCANDSVALRMLWWFWSWLLYVAIHMVLYMHVYVATQCYIYICILYVCCSYFVVFLPFFSDPEIPRSETRDRCLFREICWRLIQSNTDGLVGVALWGNPWRCIPRCKMVQDSLQCLQCLCVSLQIWHIWNIWDRWDLETHHVQIIFRRGTKGFHIDVD